MYDGIVLCPMADNAMANWSVENDAMAKKINLTNDNRKAYDRYIEVQALRKALEKEEKQFANRSLNLTLEAWKIWTKR